MYQIVENKLGPGKYLLPPIILASRASLRNQIAVVGLRIFCLTTTVDNCFVRYTAIVSAAPDVH